MLIVAEIFEEIFANVALQIVINRGEMLFPPLNSTEF